MEEKLVKKNEKVMMTSNLEISEIESVNEAYNWNVDTEFSFCNLNTIVKKI